jgi:uncharacterized protein YggT (Ycf19 family)
MGKIENGKLSNNSQEKKLKMLVTRGELAIAIGIVLLILFTISSIYSQSINSAQVDATLANLCRPILCSFR